MALMATMGQTRLTKEECSPLVEGMKNTERITLGSAETEPRPLRRSKAQISGQADKAAMAEVGLAIWVEEKQTEITWYRLSGITIPLQPTAAAETADREAMGRTDGVIVYYSRPKPWKMAPL